MIPSIRMRVPVPHTIEYASSPIATNPSYRSGIQEMETDVSLEYAAFLADEGELDVDYYVSEVHEAMSDIYDSIEIVHGEEIAFEILDRLIRNELSVAVQNNRTTWEDWV